MAYTFDIVKPPIPADDSAAWKWWESIDRDSEGALPEVFVTLYERLTDRFPCICELPDDREDEGVWCDGPLKNNFAPAVVTLGLVFPQVDHAMPFIIQTTTDLGLALFDTQTETIHRPH